MANTKRFNELMNIAQFAEATGVCKGTLRNWDRSGKLAPTLRAGNGARYYDPDLVDEVLSGHIFEKKEDTGNGNG